LKLDDLKVSPLMQGRREPIPDLKDSLAQLERISNNLVKDGFSPLHPSLMVATSADHHVPGTLTEPQALYLISTLSTLLTEFQNRGNAIQHFVHQISHSSQSRESRSGLDLEEEVKSLKRSLEKKKMLVEKLEFEAQARRAREESIRHRNQNMLDAIKQKYYYDNPGLDPILYSIIESYEEKLANQIPLSAQPPVLARPKEEYVYSPDDMDPPTPLKSLEVQLKVLKKELLQIQEERDVLSLRLINETKAYRDSNMHETSKSKLFF
jgi:hypothetical protein